MAPLFLDRFRCLKFADLDGAEICEKYKELL